MRLAVISDWYLPRLGGIELYLNDLTQRLLADGIDLEVLTPVPGPEVVNGVSVRRLCDTERPRGGYRFPPPDHAANGPDFLYLVNLFGLTRPGPIARLKAALASGGFDLAHVHLGNTPFSYLAVNACLALGLPVVATFHSVLSPAERPFFAVGGWLLGCRRWPGRADLTAVSSFAAETRRAMLGDARLGVMPNCADVDYWGAVRQARAGRLRDKSRIELFAAMRLHPRKRPLLLLDAVEAARRALPQGTQMRLRIAGGGPLRTRLEREIAARDLTDTVELCGQLPREAVRAAIAEADLFLMPSHLESFGIAALEARLAGLPVLAMRDSGMRDFLEDGVDSLLAADDRAFVEGLSRFVRDVALRERLSEGSRRPLSGYSWDDLVENCRRAYAVAVGRRETAGALTRHPAT
ncbi:MAG: glycosyltransferase family 4 protein [Devosia sp.]